MGADDVQMAIRDNNEKEEKREKSDHDKAVESELKGGRARPDVDTPFMDYSINGLKRMIKDADPTKLETAAFHWRQVQKILAGGKDGIADLLDTAVNNVLEHWEGEAASSFAKKSRDVSDSVRNCAWFAGLNSDQLQDAGTQLRHYKPLLDSIKEPGVWDRGTDWLTEDRDNTQLDKDIARGVRADTAAEANKDSLSRTKEEQLKAVAHMEDLAVQYKRMSTNLEKNPPVWEDGRIKDPDRDVEYPPPVGGPGGSAAGPSASRGTPKPWSAGGTSKIGAAPQVPRAQGITGGSQLPVAKTNVDSIKPGLTGPGLGSTPAGAGPGGPGGGPGGVPGGGIAPVGGGPGLSRAARSGIGAPSGRSGLAGGPGGSAAGRGTGARAGMGGMGGGAGAGAAGRGGAGASGRGALAKARGGVVGAPNGLTGKGTGGGAGLHGSRGGMAGGMAGGMGGRNGRRSGDENERGDRPDYLVEDEETWISEEDRNRNVPRNIE
ncbi:hypothetical protein J7E96_22065 [Streptomyces sp. ISL-96]|uniref:hypothetical protein n=1 Tax=Streptomyces sp. ISL-96 TaxID=2819191 RepID=UPI001BEA10AB|nr:hypothetical protein [Streptomyces sp. ISL-96]MBT2491159.1 hypothetical protein [Streptomyces sp. ISL-96]